MREKVFENKVKQFLKDNGCWFLKTWSNGVQRQGVPDLLICCNGYFLAIELKNETGKPSELQLWNIDQIRRAGGIAFVLYPDQFEDFKDLIIKLYSELPNHAYMMDASDKFNLNTEKRGI